MKRLLLPLVFLAAIAGCATDHNKEAQDAHDAELKAQREQREQSAEQRTKDQESSSAAHRAVTVNDAQGQGAATQDRVAADAKFQEARDKARAKAAERLDKADAKLAEIKARVDRAGGKAPTSARDAVNGVSSQRTLVQSEIAKLGTVPGDAFEKQKENVDTQLDTLEGYVKKAEKEAEKVK